MTANIIAFLGPSLEIKSAKKILNDAYYLPPVKAGDIIKVVRLKPSIILIVDGYFSQINSVWHKEILFALSRGIKVIGGSSMGALRALELEEFGMLGFGEVFKWYKENYSYDDDEVILMHLPFDKGYMNLTESMINVRFTLLNAYKKNIINTEEYDELIKTAKSIFYKNRTYDKIFEIFYKNNALAHKNDAIKNWIISNRVDQKEKDAIELLRYVNLQKIKLITTRNKKFVFSRTQYFNALYVKSMSQSFIDYHEQLPLIEKICLVARLLGKDYYHLKNLALLTQAIYNISKSKFKSITAYDQYGIDVFDKIDIGYLDDIKSEEFQHIFKYIFKFYYENKDSYKSKTNSFIKSYQLFTGESKLNNNLSIIGYMWSILYDIVCDSNFVVSEKMLLKRMAIFMRSRNIKNEAMLYEWMSNNNMDKNEFMGFIKRIYIFDYFIKKSNLHAIDLYDVSANDAYFWLEHSIYIANFYQEIKGLLIDNLSLLKAIKSFKCQLKANGKNFIFLTDFYSEENLLRYIEKLSLSR